MLEKENIIFDNFSLPINVAHRNDAVNFDLRTYHFHNAIELVYVNRGSIICEVGQEKQILYPNSIIMISSNAIHRLYYNSSNTDFTYIQIDVDKYLNNIFPNNKNYLYEFMNASQIAPYVIFEANNELQSVLDNMQTEFDEKPPYYQTSLNGYIYLLVAFLCRNNIFYDFQADQNGKAISKLIPAIEYVEENFSEKITLDDLCAAIYMDKYNFCKLFKRVTGSTFVEYLNFRRLAHAERLLTETDDTIAKIALDCGFNSIQYFNKAFKMRKKCTPNSYRKMNLKVLSKNK